MPTQTIATGGEEVILCFCLLCDVESVIKLSQCGRRGSIDKLKAVAELVRAFVGDVIG